MAKALRRDFVCAWVNKTPKAKFQDGMYDHCKNPRGLPVGTGVTNVTAVFASADGTVIHAMPGYLDPASFLRHLEFAKSLERKLSDPGIRRADRAGLYAEAHRNAGKASQIELEQAAHALLAGRFMRTDELSLDFFNRLAREIG